ncbi:hypothetical protein D9758_015592 [Tetrapyrgos nigripes]|uniref:Helicase ATP-binding domain-containing protein n=1 Tax=Tetrapyrgos nigripes TaxID=182062 RepID=A0A8H5CD83_9AGAR|nr:hypothetical protein D9758_015592 [Tetrapyrgos nigripes]
MTTPDGAWTSQLGLDTHVVYRRILQWPSGLPDWQQDTIPLLLSRQNVFAIAATGDGKSTLYIVPILVHLELSKHQDLYPPVIDPIAVAVIPTKALATSIVDTIAAYHKKPGVNLEKLIVECKTWNVICIDPKHLRSLEWACIIDDEHFKSVDKAHLVLSCVPDDVSTLALTATSAVGAVTTGISKSLTLLGDSFHLFRCSKRFVD